MPVESMKKRLLIVAICGLLLGLLAVNQRLAAQGLKGSDSVVHLESSRVDPSEIHPGKDFSLILSLAIDPEYHINSNKPLDENLIATSVNLDPTPGLTVTGVKFPKAELEKLEFSATELSVFTHQVTITVQLKTSREFSASELKGKIRIQACNNKLCLRPGSIPIAIPVKLGVADAVPTAANQKNAAPEAKPAAVQAPSVQSPQVAPATSIENSTTVSPAAAGANKSAEAAATTSAISDFEREINSKGLLLTLLGVFITGLGLSFTPCVYPLIPITISYFGGQSEGRVRRTFLMATLYVLGIALTFSTLGVIASTTGGILGSALQKPVTLVIIAGVMVVMALSMFGVYEFNLPPSLNRLINRGAESGSGVFGALIMGLLMGFISAPCIGPFVLTMLIYVSKVGSSSRGFIIFFVLALGLGTPYLFLGAFSGAAKSLPRSGEWMVRVRKVFGLILIGMAIYFLLPLLNHYFNATILMGSYIVLAGVYLIFESYRARPQWFSWAFRVLAIAAIATGGWLAYPKTKVPTIAWHQFSPALLAEARSAGKPVIIDTYADWCVPCHELDNQTFVDPKVMAESERFVALKLDLTNEPTGDAAKLVHDYDIKGMPTLMFFDSKGEPVADERVVGFVPPNDFLDRLKKIR